MAEDESGATALLCLVTRTEVVVAHLGDSRGALLRKQGGTWSSQNLTPADHTAGSPAEAARVDALQNFGVLRRENDAPRVARKVDGAVVENGALQTTRACSRCRSAAAASGPASSSRATASGTC